MTLVFLFLSITLSEVVHQSVVEWIYNVLSIHISTRIL